ncbi:MAG: oligosaccharide flippase family protein [Methylocella sp.]
MGVTVAGQTIVVFAGNVFTLVAGLPFQIYVARALGVNQLGLFGLVEAAVVTLSGFVSFGIAQTAVRFIPEYLAKGEHGHIRKLALLATLALTATGVALASCIVLLSAPVMAWFGIAPADAKLVNVMAITAPIGLLTFLYQQILRGFQEIVIMIAGTSFVALMVKIVLAIIFFQAGWGVRGYAWAVVGGGAAALAFMIAGAMRLISRLDRPAAAASVPLGHWARYASISYATGQTSNIVMHLDRFILGATIGPEAVATLMVVRQLQQLPTTFHQMFLAVVAPMFAGANGTDAAARRQTLYHLTTDWVMRLALPLILFLAVFGGSLLHLYGAEFRVNGTPLLLLCLVAVSITIASGPAGSLMSMSGLEAPLLRISVLGSALLVTLYALAIPLAGLLGVGVSLIASTLFVNLSAFTVMRRRLALRWWSARYATWPLSGGLTLAALLSLRPALGWESDVPVISLGVSLAAAYGSFLAGNLLQGMSDDDRAVFDALITKLGLTSKLCAVSGRTLPAKTARTRRDPHYPCKLE